MAAKIATVWCESSLNCGAADQWARKYTDSAPSTTELIEPMLSRFMCNSTPTTHAHNEPDWNQGIKLYGLRRQRRLPGLSTIFCCACVWL